LYGRTIQKGQKITKSLAYTINTKENDTLT